MPLDQISQSVSEHEVPVNRNMITIAPAGVLGRVPRLCIGLTFAYLGGRLSDSVTVSGGDGTMTLTDNATNYIECTTAGAPSFNTSAFTAGRIRMYIGVALGGTVTYTDVRVPGLGIGGGSGTVTSVGLSVPSVLLAVASTPVTTSGTIATTLQTQSANLVFAGPTTGSAATPTFRSLVAADIAANLITNAKSAQMAAHTYKGNNTGSTADPADISAANLATDLGTSVKSTESLIIACSDEVTALTTGTSKIIFRMPYAFTLTAIRASLSTAQASGSIFTVDVNESGTTVISTKLTIDNTEKTTTTAATPPVISDSSLADDAEMSIDIDQVGDGTAKGLKVYLIGNRT